MLTTGQGSQGTRCLVPGSPCSHTWALSCPLAHLESRWGSQDPTQPEESHPTGPGPHSQPVLDLSSDGPPHPRTVGATALQGLEPSPPGPGTCPRHWHPAACSHHRPHLSRPCQGCEGEARSCRPPGTDGPGQLLLCQLTHLAAVPSPPRWSEGLGTLQREESESPHRVAEPEPEPDPLAQPLSLLHTRPPPTFSCVDFHLAQSQALWVKARVTSGTHAHLLSLSLSRLTSPETLITA